MDKTTLHRHDSTRREDADEGLNRLHLAVLVLAALCMIASDCMALFGAGIYRAKYFGLVLLIGSSLLASRNYRLSKGRLALVFVSVGILVAEILFQENKSQAPEAAALFIGLGLIACYSEALLRTRRELLWIGFFAAVAIALLLAASWRDCLTQWRFYVGIGRPRLKGCFSNPNSLGAMASFALIMCYCGQPFSKREKIARAFGLAISLAALVASGSRTSFLMVIGFFGMLLYKQVKKRSNDIRFRIVLTIFAYTCGIALVVLAFHSLSDDVAVSLRLKSLATLSGDGLRLWVGIGYVGSGNVSVITSAAGGAAEMLPVSLFYRVGLIGIAAYITLVFSMALPAREGNKVVFSALLFAILLQAIGESYLSSIMSFPSCFIWVLLSSFPTIESNADPPIHADEALSLAQNTRSAWKAQR